MQLHQTQSSESALTDSAPHHTFEETRWLRGCVLQKKYGYSRVAMVGDGATDLEARLPDAANIFIG